MLLKIHLSKAFDSLSWTYIHQVLLAFGFSPTWIRWIMGMLSSPFFSILVNDLPYPTFSPSRGIHHSDPIYPFIFVLMEIGLGRLICHAINS